jgi:hypothetical protein
MTAERFRDTALSDQGARQNGRCLDPIAFPSGGGKPAERQARMRCGVREMAFRTTARSRHVQL